TIAGANLPGVGVWLTVSCACLSEYVTSETRDPRMAHWHQILKNHSGMATMYFKLKAHRNTILMGNEAMNRIRFANTIYRKKPILTKYLRRIVPAINGGNTIK